MNSSLSISPLFTGLTRPPMLMGVTIEYLMVSIFIPMIAFGFGQSFFYLGLWFPCYIAGWVLCRLDPHIFKILGKKVRCVNVPNKRIWGCQAYEPY